MSATSRAPWGTMFAVVLALAATLGTFVGAGMLTAHAMRYRLPYLIAWTVTLFGLSIGLGGMTVGLVVGFGPTLFRGVQVGGSLIAPLWLALGAVVLIARRMQVRFGAWLGVASYTVVALVILMVDPIPTALGPELPTPGGYDWLPVTLIALTHLVAVGALVGTAAVTALRARDRDPEAYEALVPVALIAGAGVLVVAGMGGYLPDVLSLLVLAAAAGLIWYGALRALAIPEPGPAPDEDLDDVDDWVEESPLPRSGSTGGRGRRGRGRRGRDLDRDLDHDLDRDLDLDLDVDRDRDRDRDRPHRAADVAPPTSPDLGPPIPRAQPVSPYGHITVYTLHKGREDAFDRLTEEAVRAVRDLEPDTLVYACHTAHNSPHQRVFYQLFRDRRAYQEHERQPHIQRFLTAGRAHVRTTKVIELTLGPHKVVPPPPA